MAIAGKKLRIKVATAQAGPYTTVADINSGSQKIAGQTQDVSAFGVDWVKRILGLLDGTYSLGGHYNSADASGQVAIRNALLNDTALWVQFLSDGVAGFQQEVKVASFDVSGEVGGTQSVAIELEGTGAITAV